MQMNKPKKSLLAMYAITAAVYILLFALIPFEKPGCSWLMFVFSLIAIAGSCCITVYTFGKNDSLMSKFYGYPVFRIGLIYMLLQLGLSMVMFLIGVFTDVPYWVGLLISLILAGGAAIGLIAADNTHDLLQHIDTETARDTQNVTCFNVDLGNALDLCQDRELLEPLQELATKCKYTDPVSIPQTEELEAQIKEAIIQLQSHLELNQTQQAKNRIDLISRLLTTRNRIKFTNK